MFTPLHQIIQKARHNRTLRQASAVSKKISSHLLDDSAEVEYISLGHNCNSAWYLKECALKKASYPFDWIFSSSEIIIDCLENSFETFLDKSLMTDLGNRGGHSKYHQYLFNHKNPLSSDEAYDYYRRCVNRFLTALQSEKKLVFLCTIINEKHKRPDWTNGFSHSFHVPVNQAPADVQALIKTVKQHHSNSKFIFIEQYTEQKPAIIYRPLDEDSVWVRFTASGRNDGVKYESAADDLLMKTLLNGPGNHNHPSA